MKDRIEELIQETSKIILDKEEQIRLALACIFARGHLLIEDLPGIGKTTLAQALAKFLGLEFKRVQCTNDLLPGDILGVSIFDRQMGDFTFHEGPIFSQVVLVDEINRSTPKTQSGLLEAMAEGKVTIDRESHGLPRPFFIIATQNPLEHAGTYPLPDSQLDRFVIRIHLGYPAREAEYNLLKGQDRQDLLRQVEPLLSPSQVIEIQDEVLRIHASDALLAYIQDILEFSRQDRHLQTGLSPRAGLALLNCARSWAYLENRDFVIPEDVQAVLPWVIAHRLRLSDEGMNTNRIHFLQNLFKQVPIP